MSRVEPHERHTHPMSPVPDLRLDAGLPANVDAERTILGAVLLENKSFMEASEKLEACDFSLESHARIFLRMSELMTAGRTVDIVTLANELSKHKEVKMIGGVAYLASLTEGLPRRPMIEEYIRIVKDKSLLRKLMGISSTAIARAADQSESAMDIIGAVSEQIQQAAEQGISSPLQTFDSFVSQAYPSIDAVFRQSARSLGLPSGIKELDALTCGFQRKDLIILAARPSMGKALRIDCMIKTVSGWKRNEELKIGDSLASIDGSPSMVTGIFPQGMRQMYMVKFSDGRDLETDGEHLWLVYYREWSEPRKLTTNKLIEMLGRKRYRNRLWIDTAGGHFGEDLSLPMDSWALGALLGNGCMCRERGAIGFSSRDTQTITTLAARLPRGCEMKQDSKYSWRIIGTDDSGVSILKGILSDLKIFGSRAEGKRIPEQYLAASRSTRVRLLQGLMDTDGNVEKTGSLVYSTSSPQLAADVQELARSLGAVVSISKREDPKYTYKGETRTGQRAYRVYISHPNAAEFVSLERKKERVKIEPQRQCRLTFESITPTAIKPAQCISVSHPSHLYIAERGYVVTHNSDLAITLGAHAAIELDQTVAFFSLEMSKQSVFHRLISQRSTVSRQDMREGRWTDTNKRYATEAMAEIVGAPFYIDDFDKEGAPTLHKMHGKAARLKANTGHLDLIIIDLLGKIKPPDEGKRYGNRSFDLGLITAGLKWTAKSLDVPVILLHHLSRETEKRDTKVPRLSDLRESGNIEQDADMVIFPHRPSYYEKSSSEKENRKAKIIVSKQRDGATGEAECEYLIDTGVWRDEEERESLWGK